MSYFKNNLDVKDLEYLGFVILDNLMSHLKYNNQRFYVEYNYEYNQQSNNFIITDSNILNILEWSNNQMINLDEILNQEFSTDMLQKFTDNYFDVDSFIKTTYDNIDSLNKLLLINLLNYRDILKNNFFKNDDGNLNLDIILKLTLLQITLK